MKTVTVKVLLINGNRGMPITYDLAWDSNKAPNFNSVYAKVKRKYGPDLDRKGEWALHSFRVVD